MVYQSNTLCFQDRSKLIERSSDFETRHQPSPKRDEETSYDIEDIRRLLVQFDFDRSNFPIEGETYPPRCVPQAISGFVQ